MKRHHGQKSVWVALALVVAAAVSRCALAATNETGVANATLPYSTLYNVAGMRAEWEGMPAATSSGAQVVVTSKLPNVKPEDIQLTIDSTNGDVLIKLEKDGSFHLPVSEDLIREDPPVIANQPKGSLMLTSTLPLKGLRFPQDTMSMTREGTDTKVRYADLFRSMVETQNVLSDNLTLPEGIEKGTNPPPVVRFHLKGGANPRLVIHSRRGDLEIKPDAEGKIVLQLDQDLYQENPWVIMGGARAADNPVKSPEASGSKANELSVDQHDATN